LQIRVNQYTQASRSSQRPFRGPRAFAIQTNLFIFIWLSRTSRKGDCRSPRGSEEGRDDCGTRVTWGRGESRPRKLGKSYTHPPRGGSLGIVIRAGSAANEDNGIKAFGRYQTECTKPIVNSITAILASGRKRLDPKPRVARKLHARQLMTPSVPRVRNGKAGRWEPLKYKILIDLSQMH